MKTHVYPSLVETEMSDSTCAGDAYLIVLWLFLVIELMGNLRNVLLSVDSFWTSVKEGWFPSLPGPGSLAFTRK